MGHNGPGYRIEDLWAARGRETGLRWRVWLWRPSVGRYRRVHRDGDYAAVEGWAKDEVAKLRVHRAADVTVTLAEIGKEYVAVLKDGNRDEDHWKQVQRVVAHFVAEGLTDLQAPDFFVRARAIWKAMRIRGGAGQLLQGRCMARLAAGPATTPEICDAVNAGQAKRTPYTTVASALRALARRQLVTALRGAGKLPNRWRAKVSPEAYRDTLPRLSPVTLNQYMKHLLAVCGYAVDQGVLQRNPLGSIKLEAEPETIKAVFSLADLRALVAPNDHPFRLVFVLMTYTGCRFGEALHLRWEWFDWAANRISIRRHPDYRLKRMKERQIPIQRELRAELNPKGDTLRVGWVIADTAIRDADEKTAWLKFRAYLEACGVPVGDRSPHSTRHTWVALQLACGEELYFVKRYAGHEKVSTTEGYAEAADSFRQQVAGWSRGEFSLAPAAAARAAV